MRNANTLRAMLAIQAIALTDPDLHDVVVADVSTGTYPVPKSTAVTNGRVLTSEDQQEDAKAELRKEIAEHNAAVEARKAEKKAAKARRRAQGA